MRNGVIAFRRDGTLALMNDDAYRIFNLTRSPNDLGRPFSEGIADNLISGSCCARAGDGSGAHGLFSSPSTCFTP